MTDTSATYRDILYEVKDGIAIVTLNRPDRMNAWTQLMGLEICDAMSAANEDDAVRAVVRREGRAPVMVLSLEHILESVFRSAIINEPNEKLGERV